MNTYNTNKTISRQKFNAMMQMAFEFGKKNTTEWNFKQMRNLKWEMMK